MTDIADTGAQRKVRGHRVFDFTKPIDLNTILVLVGFLGGGMYFVAETKAELASTRTEMRDLKDGVFALTNRVDTLFLRPIARHE